MSVRTKTIATLGPASEAPGILEDMVRAGADIVRLNLAHGTSADHARWLRRVRAAERRTGRSLGVLADLPGPKIRLGDLGEGRTLVTGERVRLVIAAAVPPPNLPVRWAGLLGAVRPGHRVYLADGAVRLRTRAVDRGAVDAEVEAGGFLRSRAGVNLPDGNPRLRSFTARDRSLLAALPAGVDFVGLSFVGGPGDVERLRACLRRRPRPPLIVAKIERRAALDRLEAIVRAADAVMVARGDLGVEVDFAEIPALQRRIVETAERLGRPAIVATQVLESMLRAPRPTRAEATDVANAVLEGADAILLSGETSIGQHPVAAVRALNDVMRTTEARLDRRPAPVPSTEEDRLALEARHLAERIGARRIAVPSVSGETAVRVARARGAVPVTALVEDPRLLRRLALHGGLDALRVPRLPRGRPDYRLFDRVLRRAHGLRPGDRVVFFGRFPSPRGPHWFLESVPQ